MSESHIGASEMAELVREVLDPKRPAHRRSARKSLARGFRRVREVADRLVPGPVRRGLGLLVYGSRLRPPVGWAHLGSLRRANPLSSFFGFDRGKPVDRYYIEHFLSTHAADIHGRVLEVGDRKYTTQFGGDRVVRSDVLHARAGNPEATLIGDLTTGNGVPSGAFDCIILTQVLPFVWDVPAAIATAERSLKPGGVVLVTTPGISQISRYDADRWGDYWRFTSQSIRRLFEASFAPGDLTIKAYGNALTATALLHGLATEELRTRELDERHPDYEVTIAIRAIRRDHDG